MIKRWICAFTAVVAFVPLASAEDYGVNDASAVESGVNFDPRDLSRAYPRCMDFGPDVQLAAIDPDKPIAVATTFTGKQIESRQELYRELHKSVSASGHYGLFKAGGSYSEDSQYSFDEDSLVVIVKGEIDYGRWDKSNAKLRAPYVQILGNGSAAQVSAFIESCGLEFVQRTRRGIMAALVFQFYNLTEEKQRRIKASLGGGFSSTGWGANVTAAYSSFVREASLHAQLKVSVHAIGGPGKDILGPLVSKFQDVEQVRQILDKKFFEGADITKASPTGYTTALLSSYSNGKLPGVDLSDYLRYLSTVWLSVTDLNARAERANQDVLNAEDYPLSRAEVESLHSYSSQVRGKLQRLYSRAEGCRAAYDKFTGSNRGAVRAKVASACLIDSRELEVGAYPIGLYRERRPVKFDYYVNTLTNSKRILIATVSGATLRKVYFRVPGDPPQAFSNLQAQPIEEGQLFRGALVLSPEWNRVELVAETTSGRTYVETVLAGVVTPAQFPAVAPLQQLRVPGATLRQLRPIQEF